MSYVPAYVLSITPADVGRRVSVRLRLDDGRLTDVVGDLLSWSSGLLAVRRRDGSVASIEEKRLVAGKVVPPAPTRRRRPDEHVTIDALELEEIASRGWLGLESAWFGRWLLRASEGFTGRGNSVLPLGEPGVPVQDALAHAVAWYTARGLPAKFQVPLPVMVSLDQQLAERGWSASVPVHVLTGSVAAMVAGAPERDDLPPVRFEPEPTKVWLSLYHYRGQALPPVAPRVLMQADLPVFALVRDGDDVLAIARGAVARGWLGVTALEVAPEARRRGLGTHVMRGLAAWAQDRGSRSMYLQVDGKNEVALAFYDPLGLHRHHTYHYRSAPPADG